MIYELLGIDPPKSNIWLYLLFAVVFVLACWIWNKIKGD